MGEKYQNLGLTSSLLYNLDFGVSDKGTMGKDLSRTQPVRESSYSLASTPSMESASMFTVALIPPPQ